MAHAPGCHKKQNNEEIQDGADVAVDIHAELEPRDAEVLIDIERGGQKLVVLGQKQWSEFGNIDKDRADQLQVHKFLSVGCRIFISWRHFPEDL